MNEEYKRLMEKIKQTPYSEKPKWAKKLDNLERVERRKKKRLRKNEMLVDVSFFEFYQ